ncbi:hypothetical protein [Formosa sp. 4Alg 33]|uniref:hypothetical protein n=1 Tax=Formosa sp. 4Alg 33 TaxID=3382189 RepID=UPI003D9C1C8F
MKKRAVLLVFLISLTTFAQKQNNETNKTEINQSTRFNFQRTIQLDEHKKNEEIIIKIEKQTKKFELMIDTSVTSGKLTIEIYDSNEKKQGTFSVGTQLNIENSERAQGNINKSLIDPQAGNWKVKIIPINAKGMIQINTASFL